MLTIIGVVTVIALLGGGGLVWHRSYTGKWIWH